MTQTEQIYIPFSKKGYIFYFIGAMIFVVLGLVNWIDPERYTDIWIIVGVFFFGLCAAIFLWILIGKQSGITINKEGVKQEAIGLVLWEDIVDFNLRKISAGRTSSTYLIVIIKDPKNYIENFTTNKFARKIMNSNLKSYGSPISFEATSYKMNAREIHRLLIDKLERYKEFHSQNQAVD